MAPKKKSKKKGKLLPHEESLLASGELVEKTHHGSTSRWLWAPSLSLDKFPLATNDDSLSDNNNHDNNNNNDDEIDRANTQRQQQQQQLQRESGDNNNNNNNIDSPFTLVYRPMGDKELLHLLQHSQLPDTQPYQAIIEGSVVGRTYAEKFLRGHKKVDTTPTTVVEFCVPKSLIDHLMSIQQKVEDGAISMGLGNKAGGGLFLFNQTLVESMKNPTLSPPCGFRIVLVKRKNE